MKLEGEQIEDEMRGCSQGQGGEEDPEMISILRFPHYRSSDLPTTGSRLTPNPHLPDRLYSGSYGKKLPLFPHSDYHDKSA